MKILIKNLVLILFVFTILACNSKHTAPFEAKEVYRSAHLVIQQISKNAYQHISYLPTQDFGNVPCNGLLLSNDSEVVIFDTPTNEKSSEELLKWVNDTLHAKIKAVIPTHFHADCLGGLAVFHQNNIPSYAYTKTIALAKENNMVMPKNSFSDSLVLQLGHEKVIAKFFGEGHTKDNIVGYFPRDEILFGGCLIKALDANEGFLGNANVSAWSTTVEKVKEAYPNLKIVVPGHDAIGNTNLLDYTIKLFKSQQGSKN